MTGNHTICGSLPAAALMGALMCAATACGTEATGADEALRGKCAGTCCPEDSRPGEAATPMPVITWEEPTCYTYTLESREGEQDLLGTFRVTVRHGKVAKAVGLDEDGRLSLERPAVDVPMIGELLEQWQQAREDNADKAEVTYAADGHPVRIALDRAENTIGDEALYVISDYEPVTH